MIKLNRSYNVQIENAYIITLRGNEQSEKQAANCMRSCQSVGQAYQVWEAFDGTRGPEIRIPEHLKNASWIPWLKVMDHHLSPSEVACVLSHFSLWCRCLELDQPIVILEHDAIMLKPYLYHIAYNAIAYLGCLEQKQGRLPVMQIPPHGTLNPNYHMICRAHAYAIDPAIAAQLISHVIRLGIHESLDVMIRADLFAIIQPDMIAYDDFQGTTIVNRKKDMGQER